MAENNKERCRSWKWTDAHFCNLPSHTLLYPGPGLSCGICTTPQTNVYGHTKVIDPDGSNKILVASRVGKITSLEYQIVMDKLAPSTKIIPFSYIPAGAELVSLDVISKSIYHPRIVVGITFIKFELENEDSDAACKQYLNLYSLRDEYSGFDNIDDCVSQSIDLDFVPYLLTHTIIFIEGKLESVFLLVGSDNRIHMYRKISEVQQSFTEFPTSDCFPEFENISTVVHWIDIVYYNQFTKRLTARGHRDGTVMVTNVDVKTNEIQSSWSLQHDSPITSIKIFSFENDVNHPSNINFLGKQTHKKSSDPVYHVLVVSALEPAAVYRDILVNGLKEPLVLPGSNKYDIPLCVCIVDIDFDGCNEILIGTYGQELLAYKLISPDLHKRENSLETFTENQDDILENLNDPNRNRHLSDENKQKLTLKVDTTLRSKSHENLTFKHSTENLMKSNIRCASENVIDKDNSKDSEHFELLWQRSFACPVMGVDRVDIMGDGMEDLIVVTLKGVHIIQPDMQEIAKVCLERMNMLTKMKMDFEKDKSKSTSDIRNVEK